MPKALTLREKKFVDAITSGKFESATQAAIAAGYAKNSAPASACENLRKPNVRAAIDAEEKRTAARHDIKKDDLIDVCRRMITANASDIMSWDGKTLAVRSFDEIPIEVLGAIESVKQTEREFKGVVARTLEVKLASKSVYVQELNRMLGYHAPTKIDATVHPPSTVMVEMPPERLAATEAREAERLRGVGGADVG
jgi:phage terminase small subunit